MVGGGLGEAPTCFFGIFLGFFFRFLDRFFVLEKYFFGAVAFCGLLGCHGALYWRFGPSGVA